jgi:hypothetical protein
MKRLGKLLGDFVAWRWAPAIGLCIASLFYVLLVVALVPDEIGVPVANARFTKKLTPATTEQPEAPTFPRAAAAEPEPAPPAMAPVRQAGVVDFGRRGFTPPLERPEPPPAPAPAPVVVPPPPAVIPPPTPEAPAPAEPPAAGPGGEVAVPAPPVAALPPSATPTPAGLMRSMQAFRNLPFSRPQPGQPPNAQPQPPNSQPPNAQPPVEPAPPAPGQ